jgi:hypothetical protein
MTTKTGPQRYPGASTAYWYGSAYPGSAMEVNVVVLHTTEGRTLPDYSGGASAPTLTAVPDLAAKKLKWYQHFDIDTSARALVNLSGGVETNTLNVCQVELVGTCDPTTHTKWGSSPHVYWPQAPDWALSELAVFLRWMHAEHGVPLSGPAKWPAYPSSYGSAAGARMSGAQWNAFSGVCGHLHVPENVHGDPGAIDFNRLIALAKGTTTEEDDMPTPAEIAKAILTYDGVILVPGAPATNPTWTLSSVQTEILKRVDRANLTLTAQRQTIDELVKAVATLAAGIGTLDPASIVAELRAAIESIDIHLDATP